MPLKLTRRLPAVDGALAAGNTLTQRVPLGFTIHQVMFTYAFLDGACAVALATAVDQIRIVANGKPIWTIKGSELDTMNQFQGRAAASGILTIDFDRFNLRTRTAEEFTSLGSGFAGDPMPLTTLTVEIDLASGGGVDGGTITAHYRISEPRQLGLFKKIRRFTRALAGAGDFDEADYPKGELINAVYFYESANDIDRMQLFRDDFIVFDRTKELNSKIQTDGVRTPQSNLFVFDTSEDGNGSDQLVTRNVNDLRFRLTVDGAMTLTSLVEYIGGLEL